ncbi:MAG: hypothetical protein Kow0074_24640 [Candidatus Zixiibacteriota bacterium]
MLSLTSLAAALALVLILSLSAVAQKAGTAAGNAAFRHVTTQTETLTSNPASQDGFTVLVFHPGGRTDFGSLEQSIQSVAGARQLTVERHALNDPETAALLRSLRMRMAPNQTMIVFRAPNGALTWGGSEAQLGKVDPNVVFPSPQMCEIIKTAQSGRDVLLVFADDQQTNGARMIQSATSYVQKPGTNADLFVIDPTDPSNQDVIARTKLPPDSLTDARMLLLVGGRVAGQISGAPSLTGDDIAALKKSCSGKSGCC